jgi:hypothetical protein
MVEAVAVKQLSELEDRWEAYNVVTIDEGQFFLDVSYACLLTCNIDCGVLGKCSTCWQDRANFSPKRYLLEGAI